MKSLYLPSPKQLVKQFIENDFYEDPDLIYELLEEKETCPIYNSLKDLENWILNQTITRKIDTIWLHCTGTVNTATVTGITNYWKNHLKWKNPGYHILFSLNGFSTLQDLQFPTNGVRGHNSTGIHISYIGGLEKGKAKDTRNNYQQQLMHANVQILKRKYPHLNVRGHNEVANKACPVFNTAKEFSYARI